jgi:protein tyrosine phosphatase type IVA
VQELKNHNVKDVVRVCEPTYKVDELKQEGINVLDLEYEDGTPPPQEASLNPYFCYILKSF